MKKVTRKIIAVFLCVATVFGHLSVSAQAKIKIFDYYLPFGVWQGEGDTSVVVKYHDSNNHLINDALAFAEFEGLYLKGEEISKEFYTLEAVDGFVKITLKEEYVVTLEDNAYYLDAEYKNIDMQLKLYVIRKKATVDNIVFESQYRNKKENVSFTITGVNFPLGGEILEYISLNGEKLPKDCYRISFLGNSGIVGLNSDYAETLPIGTHEFDIEFMSVSGIKLRLNILPSTGLMWDTWESYLENMTETTLRALSVHRKGDINGDGRITAADARMCLRNSALIEELNEPQKTAADINNDGCITSADARKILRISADVDVVPTMNIETTSDWGFIIGSLKNAGSGRYSWQYEIDNDGLAVTKESIDNSDGKDGEAAEQFFIFTPEKSGEYTITFTLTDSGMTEVIDTFKVNVIVAEAD